MHIGFGDQVAPSADPSMKPDRAVSRPGCTCQTTMSNNGPNFVYKLWTKENPGFFNPGSRSFQRISGTLDTYLDAGRPHDTEQIGGILMACGIAKRALRASCQHLPIRGFHDDLPRRALTRATLFNLRRRLDELLESVNHKFTAARIYFQSSRSLTKKGAPPTTSIRL